MPRPAKKLFLSLIAISNSSKSPEYRICVDGVELADPSMVEDSELHRKNFIYTADFDDIKKITIQLLNKEHGDTIVVDDKIVEDVLLIIEQLRIDHLDLINNLSKISVYKNKNNEVFKTNGYITFNGTITIKIHKNLLYNSWLSSLFN